MYMDKAKTVVEYYVICNKLKDIIRTGWKDWGVKRQRVESVAEHIYGVQMLAVAMWAEYKYEIDIRKVLSMLAIHELEETVIGDLTMFQIDKDKKAELGHKAVKDILSKLALGYNFEELILEFDARETAEAKFAYQCDKLECDLQCRIYDEESCVDLSNQSSNSTAQDKAVKVLLDSGMSWSQMWLKFGQDRYPYDNNFRAVSNYAMENNILDNNKK